MLSSVCLSVCCMSSVTLVRPTQAIEIFGNVSMPFGTLASKKFTEIVPGNPSVGGLNATEVAKYSDFGPFESCISDTLQDMI